MVRGGCSGEGVETNDLARAVHRPAVQARALVGRVLDLQAGLNVLDGGGDEADGSAGQHAGERVAQCRQRRRHGGRADGGGQLRARAQGERGDGGLGAGREEVLVQQAAVEGQRAQHHAVHEHPPDQRWRGALVQPADALVAQRLAQAVDGAGEVRARAGLQAHFDGVEGVADCGCISRGFCTGSTGGGKGRGVYVPLSLAIPEATPPTNAL